VAICEVALISFLLLDHLNPRPYPLPVRDALLKERLEVVLQPLVVIMLEALAESFHKLLL